MRFKIQFMKKVFLVILILISLAFSLLGQPKSLLECKSFPEIYIDVTVTQSQLQLLANSFSIDKVNHSSNGLFNARICLSNSDITLFEDLDIPYTICRQNQVWVKMANTYQELVTSWNSYPTYSAYLEIMEKFATDYPNLCKIDTILSQTPGGHAILCAHISSDINHVGKPSFFYSSTIHGDEVLGYYLLIRLIDKLLRSYSNDEQIKMLIDNTDIWICPLHNPDGTYRTSNNQINESPISTRTNANNIDLNRSFPQVGGIVSKSVYEPEVLAMINFFDSHNFTIAANLHGGAEVFNYPWDSWMTWQKKHADHEWWNYVGRCYADTCHKFNVHYMSELDNGVTPGGDWYIVQGSMQDYHNYFSGSRHVTIEVSTDKVVSSFYLPYYWTCSNRSFINFIAESGNGLHGVVTDSITQQPLKATIFIENHDVDHSEVETSLPHGDYHRPLKAGHYFVTYSSPGYHSKTIEIDILDGCKQTQDIRLVKSTGLQDFEKKFKIYPNPVKDNLLISLEEFTEKQVTLSIYDSRGKLLITENIESFSEVNVSNFSKGVYFITIGSDSEIFTSKFVKL